MPDVVSLGRGPGNVTPPLPGTGTGGMLGGISGLWGARYGGGQGMGYGSRYMRAGRKPGLDLPPPAGMENLDQVQNGYDPEKLYGVQNKTQVSGDRLRAISEAAGWGRGPGIRGVSGPSQGVGLGSQSDMLRRLLEARMGGGF